MAAMLSQVRFAGTRPMLRWTRTREAPQIPRDSRTAEAGREDRTQRGTQATETGTRCRGGREGRLTGLFFDPTGTSMSTACTSRTSSRSPPPSPTRLLPTPAGRSTRRRSHPRWSSRPSRGPGRACGGWCRGRLKWGWLPSAVHTSDRTPSKPWLPSTCACALPPSAPKSAAAVYHAMRLVSLPRLVHPLLSLRAGRWPTRWRKSRQQWRGRLKSGSAQRCGQPGRHQRDDHPCLIYLDVISLVPSLQVSRRGGAAEGPRVSGLDKGPARPQPTPTRPLPPRPPQSRLLPSPSSHPPSPRGQRAARAAHPG